MDVVHMLRARTHTNTHTHTSFCTIKRTCRSCVKFNCKRLCSSTFERYICHADPTFTESWHANYQQLLKQPGFWEELHIFLLATLSRWTTQMFCNSLLMANRKSRSWEELVPKNCVNVNIILNFNKEMCIPCKPISKESTLDLWRFYWLSNWQKVADQSSWYMKGSWSSLPGVFSPCPGFLPSFIS